MSERQEKMWVVIRTKADSYGYDWPVKVFDDRSDARIYCARLNKRSRRYFYQAIGVKRG